MILPDAGRNASRAEFYYQKVINFANTDRIGISALGVGESFTQLFVLCYIWKVGRVEASSLLNKFLWKGCSRVGFSREGNCAETLVVIKCIIVIIVSIQCFQYLYWTLCTSPREVYANSGGNFKQCNPSTLLRIE